MLQLDKSKLVFLHIPKTGGTFLRKALVTLGIPHTISPGGAPYEPYEHARMDEARHRYGKRVKCFMFVRHPLTWLQSYWADRMDKGWGGDLAISHDCQCPTFNGFVARVCLLHPGFVSELFHEYTKCEESGEEAPLVLKCENLVGDLAQLLSCAREDFDPKKLAQLPPENVIGRRPEYAKLIEYEPNIKHIALQLEDKAIQQYNYQISKERVG